MISGTGVKPIFGTVRVDRWAEFHAAARNGDLDSVKSLARFVNVNATDKMGVTALQAAVEGNHVEVVNYLLASPTVDVNTKDADGNTPLLLACGMSGRAIIEALLNHGRAEVNAYNDVGDGIHDMLEGNPDKAEVAAILEEFGVVPPDDSDGTYLSYPGA